MTNLTKEYFDQRLGAQTKELKSYTDKKVSGLATKEDLKKLATKTELEDLAAMTQRGFDSLEKRLDVREDVDKLKREMKQVQEALRI